MNNTNTTTTKITKGSTVKWRSQSQGTFKTKKGVVAAIVKAGQKPPVTFAKKINTTGVPRKQVSYIIEAGGGKFYWPWASQLKAV